MKRSEMNKISRILDEIGHEVVLKMLTHFEEKVALTWQIFDKRGLSLLCFTHPIDSLSNSLSIVLSSLSLEYLDLY